MRVQLLLVGLLLAACVDTPSSEAGGSGVSVHDSAGVRIVENHDSAWTAETRWTLADEPDLVIGSVDGSIPGTDFSRVSDVLLVDGHIVVADGLTRLLRVFDGDGRWLRDLGGQGDGPFEFRFLQAVFAVGDSVAVWDANRQRAVFLPVDGGTPRAARFETSNEPGEGEFVETLLPDGRAIVGPSPAFGAAVPEGPPTPIDRLYRVVREAGTPGDTIGRLPFYLAYRPVNDSTSATPLWAPPSSFEAAEGDAVWFGWAIGAYELRRIPLSDGAGPELRVRRSWEPASRPVGLRDDIMSYLDSIIAEADIPPEAAARQREFFSELEIVDPLPAWWDFEVGSDGHLWVNDFRRPEEATVGSVFGEERIGSTRWSVFAPDGRWLGTVDMPGDFLPTDFGPVHVLGIRTDDLDVQWIERYPIVKPD